MPFKLSAVLQSHTADVRAVLSPSSLRVFSASRDGTAIVWSRPSESSPFTSNTVYKPSASYVGALAYLPPTSEAPEGYLITGSQDALISVYILGSPSEDPKYMLLGHQHNVCALHASPDGTIISGSWDKTARVWKDWNQAYELQGHTQSVLAVLSIPRDTPAFTTFNTTDQFLTASADKSIKLWAQHKAVRTFNGHADVVRALVLIPDLGFASSSNDTEIRVWTAEGDTVYVLGGHTSFVYSLSLLDDGGIVSGGEDRTMRVWRDGECVQSIVHPAISVWAVTAVPGSGDVISGCSDGVVRVFSPAEARWMSEDQLKSFDDLVAASAIPAQTTQVDKGNLPGMEALSQPGKKEGQVIMVKTPAGGVEAHQWTEGSWQKVGDVVDPPGGASGGKQIYKGKEYDHVFEVDVQEGAPKLKLPYNESESAFVAAQRFLNDHELPHSYMDEVVNYIDKMTGGSSQPVSGGYVDPFTGASRYVANPTTTNNSNQVYMDPFTGASRYQAPSSTASTTPTALSNQFMDPFTGASRYSGMPPAAAPAPVAQPKIIPVKTTLPFKTANVAAMQTKLLELNELLKADPSSALALSPAELQSFDNIFNFLKEAYPSGNGSATLAWSDELAALEVVKRWPQEQRFPVLDMIRLVLAFSPVPTQGPSNPNDHVRDALVIAADWQDTTQPQTKPRETNLLLSLRALTNCFQIGPNNTTFGGGNWTIKLFGELSKLPYDMLSKNQRVALSTLVFNFSCTAFTSENPTEAKSAHYKLVLKILESGDTDSETIYRALVALGNSIYLSKQKDKNVRVVVEKLLKVFNEDRVRVIVGDILGLLK